jgi:hypothetical protein
MNSDRDFLSLKLRRYLTQYDYLENLLQETKFLFDEYNKTFLSEYYDENELNNSSSTQPNPTPISDEHEISCDNTTSDEDPIIKQIYKRLSLKTHPDKVPHKINTFKKINELYRTRNLIGLVKIAKDLRIDITDILHDPQKMINTFDTSIQNIEKQIHELTNSLAWHWAHATEEQKQIFKQANKK